jgi:hypothetical protein
VSAEARELTLRMLQRDPRERLTAQGALEHRWFGLAQNRVSVLSSALDNMKKYHNPQNEARFDVAHIKPSFAIPTSTPLLGSRFGGCQSPLILGQGAAPFPSPPLLPIHLQDSRAHPTEEQKVVSTVGGLQFNNIALKKAPLQPLARPPDLPPIPTLNPRSQPKDDDQHSASDEAADFHDSDIDENTGGQEDPRNIQAVHKSFVPNNFAARELPQSPGFTIRKQLSYMKTAGSPLPMSFIRRDGKLQLGQSYLARLVKHKSPELRPAAKDTKPMVYTISIRRKKDESPLEPNSIGRLGPSALAARGIDCPMLLAAHEESKRSGKFNFKATLLMNRDSTKRSACQTLEPSKAAPKPPESVPAASVVRDRLKDNL